MLKRFQNMQLFKCEGQVSTFEQKDAHMNKQMLAVAGQIIESLTEPVAFAAPPLRTECYGEVACMPGAST
jgi:hypothetical protein